MSKKLLAVFLVVLLMTSVFALSACKKNAKTSEPDDGTSITTSAEDSQTAETSASDEETSFSDEPPSSGNQGTGEDPVIVTVTGIELFTAPAKIEYAYGEELDTTGAIITVLYSNDTNEQESVTAEMVTGYNAEQAGEQTLTVTYGEFTATFTVTVAARIPELVSTALTAPAKTEYAYGDALDLSGAKITYTYDDETTTEVAVTAEMVTGYNAEQAGEQTLTVTYGEFTATFTVTVAARIPELVSTALTAPAKTEYAYGDALDLSGAKITYTYDDETTTEVAVTAEMVTGYSSITLGEQTVTVTYGEFGATFTVTVSVPSGTDPYAYDCY